MSNEAIAPAAVRKVVIAGGGTAGWMAAITLSTHFGKLLDITLVESEEIGAVGVGESTVPPIVAFHELLGIDERHFMRECAATFKLAIWFENWGRIGDRYIHPFGRYGQATWMAEFHNFWLHARAMGSTVPIDEYCHESLAALKGRFARRENPRINYAYHFDAALYARFLRKISEARGTKRVEGKIKTVRTNEHTGFVESLELNDGRLIDGDLFIDCTGFRGLLIEGALHTGFEDWAHWLPCDSAVAAFGLASGFVEPLESTSIHMIMTAAVRLAHFFPFNGVQQSMVEQYNDLARNEIEQIRDFVCMHYHCTQRDDSDFWRYCRNMEIPASLQRRIDLFREGGYLYQGKDELFRVDSWIAVFLGQNIEPSTYHHFARTNDKELAEYLARHRSQIAEVVNALPAHADFVRQYAGASPDAWDLALQGSPVANSYRGASLR